MVLSKTEGEMGWNRFSLKRIKTDFLIELTGKAEPKERPESAMTEDVHLVLPTDRMTLQPERG